MTPSAHRRAGALLSLISVLAFMAGAGLDTPAVVPAAAVLLIAVFVQPTDPFSRVVEPVWRVLALLLALRAGYVAFAVRGDAVLPMVDLLLLLLCAEALRARDRAGDARLFALTFALLIASAAYRPGPAFAVLFVLYIACVTVMLAIGHLRRQAESHQLSTSQPTGRFILRLALSSTVVLAISVVVFLFFPRVSRGWAARGAPVVAGSMVGFSDRVSLGDHGARILPNPEVVLRIEFPDGRPAEVGDLHWRGRSYDYFDGVAWRRTAASTPPLEQRWPGPRLRQVIYARPLANVRVLFGLHPVVDVTPLSRIRPIRLSSGDFAYVGEVDPVYRVDSRAARPDAASLRSVAIGNPPEVLAHLQLPPLSERILALADSFRAASTSPYDQAVAIERWLRTAFEYTLELPASRREATLDHFLFERRAGHCEYFSTAMAVLLRAGGVPARNVNGFLGGEWNDFGDFLTVTQNQAHSWVEVFFPGYGWVTFDPTPGGGTAAVAATSTGDRFGALRRLADGLSHRWGKWVLDYDIGTQLRLLERFAAPFERPSDAPVTARGVGRGWYVVAALIALAVLAVSLRRFRRAPSERAGAATRAYVTLRRSYERAGYPVSASTPPLAFAALVRDAPGAEPARAAIELYVGNRFGGVELDRAAEVRLGQYVRDARAQLRTQRRSVGERVRR